MHFQLPFNPAKKRKLDEDEVQRFYEPYTLDKLNGNIPIILHPNDTVKMNDGSLMTIHHFEQELQMVDDELNITIFVVGRKFLRFKDRDDLGGFLKKSPQEVFQLASSKRLPFGRDRPRHPVHSVCRKVNLIKTNLSHKDFQSPDPGTFICRYICDKNSIVRLSAQEADEGRTRVDDTRRRNMFVHRRANPPPADPRKRYTFGDAFCGVGGMSAGARKAGLEVRWGFDFDYETCVTYAENFHCSTVFNGSVNQYLSLAEQSHVDVMHISPPCQTFSRAHTIPGKNDDDNTAALFSVTQLLLKARPRICTIEEVPGFIQMEENRFYFQSFLRQILDAEYSVKWKILRAEEYGVPQCRERLIFLLACPGQQLPDFPAPSHGPGRRQPYVTVRQSIQGIAHTDPLHRPRPQNIFPKDAKFVDLDKPLKGTIMASYNNFFHRDEFRPFTLRELARVQSFGDAHVLGGVKVQKQSLVFLRLPLTVVGNAVPVLLAQSVFGSVITTLRATDGLS